MDEPIFKNYKEKQAYYREKYKNRGNIVHISKVMDGYGKVKQPGKTYYSEKGELRAIKRRAKEEQKMKK